MVDRIGLGRLEITFGAVRFTELLIEDITSPLLNIDGNVLIQFLY